MSILFEYTNKTVYTYFLLIIMGKLKLVNCKNMMQKAENFLKFRKYFFLNFLFGFIKFDV